MENSTNIDNYMFTQNQIFTNLSLEELKARHQENKDGVIKVKENLVLVNSGDIKGRLANDKYVITTKYARKNVWWEENGSGNKPLDNISWRKLKDFTCKNLVKNDVYVVDGFFNADPKNKVAIRLVTDVVWIAYFFKILSITPTKQEEINFKPIWSIMYSPSSKFKNYEKLNMNSSSYIVSNLKHKETIIGGTYHAPEISKLITTVMSYFLSFKDIGVFQCSVSQLNDKASMFFGLTGSGKTSLALQDDSKLLDNEVNTWSKKRIFACSDTYAVKAASVPKEYVERIWNVLYKNVLIENANFDENNNIIFSKKGKNEFNTHITFPKESLQNSINSIKKVDTIFFLSRDPLGVLPKVSKLTKSQAIYHFLSGYTSVAEGIEHGVLEPKSQFSSCYARPFLLLEPTKYAKILLDRLKDNNVNIFLINVGWIEGDFKIGTRVPVEKTKELVKLLTHNFENLDIEYKENDILNLNEIAKISIKEQLYILENKWSNIEDYNKVAKNLAKKFTENYKQFKDSKFAMKYEKYGPKI